MSNLLPCLFCGGEAVKIGDRIQVNHSKSGLFYIKRCPLLGNIFYDFDAALWNTRALQKGGEVTMPKCQCQVDYHDDKNPNCPLNREHLTRPEISTTESAESKGNDLVSAREWLMFHLENADPTNYKHFKTTEENNLKVIKQIQQNAITHGMKIAAEVASGCQDSPYTAGCWIHKAILTAAEKLKDQP